LVAASTGRERCSGWASTSKGRLYREAGYIAMCGEGSGRLGSGG
jgi:hypothetical protein